MVIPGSALPIRAEANALGDPCHIAITVPNGVDGYDLPVIGVSSFLNWGKVRPSGIPSYIDHVKVLRVRDDLYPSELASLDTYLTLPQYQGQVWIIGNEPDTTNNGQDGVTAEVYAERYYEMATKIRSLDLTASIGFGPVVQPTPLRIRYLQKAIDHMATTLPPSGAGTITDTLALIDIFTPHAFILNEQPFVWGAGIPPGFENDHNDAFIIDIFTQVDWTHDINLFNQFVTGYRQWMKNIGAQDKPLWLTEYGSLMPPIDPPDGRDLVNVTDEATRDYMLATFDSILNTKDPAIGYAADDNRLVQRGYWYSLNEFRYMFGGALFDPLTTARTIVGDAYVAYNPPPGSVSLVNPDVYPVSARLIPLHYTPGTQNSRVDYRLEVRVGNNVISDLLTGVSVDLRENGGGGAILATGQGDLARCGGVGIISMNWDNVVPNTPYDLVLDVTVQPASGVDTDLGNNSLLFPVTPGEPKLIMLPLLSR
jgi:hypothetical protein